jgi:Pyruvate/2-oxoacid:ferredoxin oxidoreductase delta subunit
MRIIPGLDGPSLFATEDGRIFLSNRVERLPVIPKGFKGYKSIYWLGRSYTVHRLVAAAYLGLDILDSKTQVNHKDLNKLNNHVSNLELVTQGQNIRHYVEDYMRRKWPHDNDHQIQCRSCMEVKPHGDFNESARGRYGRSATCKVCRSEKYGPKKKWYETDSVREYAPKKKWYE